MNIKYILYNPKAGDGTGLQRIKNLEDFCKGSAVEYYDITQIDDYDSFLKEVIPQDDIVICGGDGTLNRFVNKIYHLNIKNNIFYYATGSGNDFWRDLEKNEKTPPIRINKYIKRLPAVIVNGKSYRFINGVGFGIDGYCCEVGDRLKEKGQVPNYRTIAIKGMISEYKPTSATVTIDGRVKEYKKIWIAPTMNGRFYGGGMMAAPKQQRNNKKGLVSFVAMHDAGKLRTLMVFPSIFKGTHTKHTHIVDEIKGKHITVEFDRPVALQIDGETILNVTKYEVKTD